MSTVKANTFQDATGGSNAVFSGVASPPNGMGFRNRIINGDMRIDQRNAGASVGTGSGSTVYTVDRWQAQYEATNKFTVQQSTVAPAGFVNSLLVTSSSAYTPTSTQWFAVAQSIEGVNIADLGWGSAGAQSITVSFWVRSSLTGTFGGSVTNASWGRSYPFSYTISAANTWEQKTVTIAGDTTGTWNTNTSTGLTLRFSLGTGSSISNTAGSWYGSQVFAPTGATSVVGTNGATFYITGVQLEAGTVASPFERRDYGRELIMCQRYYELIDAFMGYSTSAGARVTSCIAFAVPKRTAPTLGLRGALTVTSYGIGTGTQSSASVVNQGTSAIGSYMEFPNFSGLSNGVVYYNYIGNSNSITLSAEL